MRILLAGAQEVLGQALIERLGTQHEILALTHGSVGDLRVPTGNIDDLHGDALQRFMLGCQSMIHLWQGPTPPLEDAARAAGITHIVRVVPWQAPHVSDTGCCILRVAPMIGPGDPHGVGQAWINWAMTTQEMGTERTVLVDHRDVVGGIESALWKGQHGAMYPLVGANPTRAELATLLQALNTQKSPDSGTWVAPGEDVGQIDTSRAEADLGWWHRSIERSLSETVAGL